MENYKREEKISILVLTFLGFLFDGFDFLIYSYTIVSIEAAFNTNDATMGLIQSLTLFSTLIGAIVFGWISDRFGRKKGLMLTIGFYGISTLISGFTQNIYQFTVTRILAGFGIGGEWGIGFSLLSEAWDKRKGLAGGILQSAFSVGMVLAIFVSEFFITSYPSTGWRFIYFTGGIPAILVAIIRYYVPESIQWKLESRHKIRMERLKIFIQKDTFKNLLITLLLTSGFFFMAYAIITWWPKILEKIYGISPATFSFPLMIGSLIQVPIIFFVGYISDRIGRKNTSILFATLTFISLILWLIFIYNTKFFYGSIWTWPIMIGYLFYQAVSLYIGVFGIWFSEIFSLKIKSTASNISYMAGRGIGGALSASLVVVFSTYLKGLQYSMISMALIGVLGSLIAIFLLPDKMKKTIKSFP